MGMPQQAPLNGGNGNKHEGSESWRGDCAVPKREPSPTAYGLAGVAYQAGGPRRGLRRFLDPGPKGEEPLQGWGYVSAKAMGGDAKTLSRSMKGDRKGCLMM